MYIVFSENALTVERLTGFEHMFFSAFILSMINPGYFHVHAAFFVFLSELAIQSENKSSGTSVVQTHFISIFSSENVLTENYLHCNDFYYKSH